MQRLKINISITMVILSMTACSYKLSLSESRALANDFFNGKLPPEVRISDHMRGQADNKYKVRKDTFTFDNRPIKLFYSVTRAGKIGEMFIDGMNLNTLDTSHAVQLTRDMVLSLLNACGDDFFCALSVLAKMVDDCKLFQDATNCFYCEQYAGSGGDFCPWLERR